MGWLVYDLYLEWAGLYMIYTWNGLACIWSIPEMGWLVYNLYLEWAGLNLIYMRRKFSTLRSVGGSTFIPFCLGWCKSSIKKKKNKIYNLHSVLSGFQNCITCQVETLSSLAESLNKSQFKIWSFLLQNITENVKYFNNLVLRVRLSLLQN